MGTLLIEKTDQNVFSAIHAGHYRANGLQWLRAEPLPGRGA
jgi:hypothetical protein